MSQKYPGGFITKTPTAPTASAAPGIWTVDQAMQNQKAGNWPSPPSPYIEDYFSTYLYTGNSSTQTITNGIDLSTKGGLVWLKERTANYTDGHWLVDTLRGTNNVIKTNTTGAQLTISNSVTAFNANGFSIGANASFSSTNYVSWTFAERQKFFDIVTYTGNGVSGRTLAHSLGSVPGCMIVKSTSNSDDWIVYHRGLSSPTTSAVYLNSTSAVATGLPYFPTTPTATDFYLAGSGYSVNQSGQTYVAYLFAHDAGGFGLTGTDNVISCGSLTSTSGVVTATLGYEPQWIMMKNTTSADSWYMYDTMRGMSLTNDVFFQANNANAEGSFGASYVKPIATGFTWDSTAFGGAGDNYIYIAIRRGPMKVPTDGTKVYGAVSRVGTGANATVAIGSFPPDLTIIRGKDAGYSWRWGDRLRGNSVVLRSNLTNAELTGEADLSSFNMNGFSLTGTGASLSNSSGVNYINYAMGRAPGFFDEVCYTGTGVARTVAHNLTVVPELMIVKPRSNANTEWNVYAAPLGPTKYLYLQGTNAVGTGVNRWNDTSPTSSVFTVATDTSVNGSGYTLVAYLFATCAGVSKVGSYTGTAALLTVNCGFTSGARFVLIKRTDSTGDWYTYDSVRGLSSGNDPYLLLNDTAAEVGGTNYVDTDTTGFKVTGAAPAALNANGGTYIFLAIA